MELHEHIPNSKIEIIQDCGHMIPIEQAEILAKIIQDWLDQQTQLKAETEKIAKENQEYGRENYYL